MTLVRREVLAGGLALAAAGFPALAETPLGPMHGLIGRMRALPGQRDLLLQILLEGTSGMPGCLSYVVAKDGEDPDGIWITEVWDSRESHMASLQLPAVRAVIPRARPLIAGFDNRHETEPVGGVGLPAR